MLLQNTSIRRKLTVVNLATSCLALGFACLGFSLYERASFRAAMSSELSTLADTLGANTAASLTFNEPRSAQKVLSALRAAGNSVPFGFVTSECTPEMQSAAEAAGALFFIIKPFTPERFKEALSTVLG